MESPSKMAAHRSVGGKLQQLDHVLRHGPVGVLWPAAPSAERYARRGSDDSVSKVTPSGVSSELGGTDRPRNRDGFGHRSKADHLRRSHECGAVKRLVRRAVPAQDGNRPQDLIPTGCIQLGWRREAERPAFALVKVGLVGLAGLEPAASSLSAIEGSALCGPAFSQVAGDRQGRSNAFFDACYLMVTGRRRQQRPCYAGWFAEVSLGS